MTLFMWKYLWKFAVFFHSCIICCVSSNVDTWNTASDKLQILRWSCIMVNTHAHCFRKLIKSFLSKQLRSKTSGKRIVLLQYLDALWWSYNPISDNSREAPNEECGPRRLHVKTKYLWLKVKIKFRTGYTDSPKILVRIGENYINVIWSSRCLLPGA